MKPLRIYLETGKRWVFACALDWPGWARRGKGEGAAIDNMVEYADRYAMAVGVAVPTGSVDVIGRVATRSGMADFGAPGAVGPWDDGPLTRKELVRQSGLLEASWAYLDAVAATDPDESPPSSVLKSSGRARRDLVPHIYRRT